MLRVMLAGAVVLSVLAAPGAVLADSGAPEDMDGRLERCAPYRAAVEAILAEEGVSADFYYLMAAESGCRPGARSSRGAVGFWQMTGATARHYGCQDREDLESATRAAARYLRSLSARFETLAEIVMAYNMGGHNFKKYGSTREARGLAWTVEKLKREDRHGRENTGKNRASGPLSDRPRGFAGRGGAVELPQG